MKTLVNDAEGWIQFIVESGQRSPPGWSHWSLMLLILASAALRVRTDYHLVQDFPLPSPISLALSTFPYNNSPLPLKASASTLPSSPLVSSSGGGVEDRQSPGIS